MRTAADQITRVIREIREELAVLRRYDRNFLP
jgi:hypothetical protein